MALVALDAGHGGAWTIIGQCLKRAAEMRLILEYSNETPRF